MSCFKATTRTGAIVLVCLLSGALACVSAGQYDAKVTEAEALAARKADLEREVAELKGTVTLLEASETDLAQQLSEREALVSEMQSTYDALMAELHDELQSGKVEIEKIRDGIRLSLDDEILFESGSANLDSNGRQVLTKVASKVEGSPSLLEVLGHTDDLRIRKSLASRYPSNWELGGARAASVVRLLQQEGISGERLRATSIAEFDPVVPNVSDANRSRNRRIEIRLRPTRSSVPAAPDGD